MDKILTQVPFYRSPPIIERVASLYAETSPEVFERGLDSWRELVVPEYPFYEPLTEWLLPIEEREGVPFFAPGASAEVTVKPRFSKKKSSDGFDWSIRCPCGQLTVNMHSTPEQSSERRFPHLYDEFARWLPIWLNHFKPTIPREIVLYYVNILDHKTVPNFYDDQGALTLGRILRIFSHIPGDFETMTPPYDCKATLKLKGRESATLQIRVYAWPHGSPAIRVDLDCRTKLEPEEAGSTEKILWLMEWCHQHIVNEFEAVFTEEAKAAFNPKTE